MKLYQVVHKYDECGYWDEYSNGGIHTRRKVLFACENESDAKEFVEKYSQPHIVNISGYGSEWCGELYVEPLELNAVSHQDYPEQSIVLAQNFQNIINAFDMNTQTE